MVARGVLVGHEARNRPPDSKVQQSEISHERSEEDPGPVRGIAEAVDDERRQHEADDRGDGECRPVGNRAPEHARGAAAHERVPTTPGWREEGNDAACRVSRRSSAATWWYCWSSRRR